METLFESFLFNFYRREQAKYNVTGETIKWNFGEISVTDGSFLPRMEPDITLSNKEQKIIIDAKYYPRTLLLNRYGEEKFRSSHLYQIFSYLLNQEIGHHNPKSMNCSGVLIYPQVDRSLSELYQYRNHKILIKTIDLSMHWSLIRKKLLNIIDIASPINAFIN